MCFNYIHRGNTQYAMTHSVVITFLETLGKRTHEPEQDEFDPKRSMECAEVNTHMSFASANNRLNAPWVCVT